MSAPGNRTIIAADIGGDMTPADASSAAPRTPASAKPETVRLALERLTREEGGKCVRDEGRGQRRAHGGRGGRGERLTSPCACAFGWGAGRGEERRAPPPPWALQGCNSPTLTAFALSALRSHHHGWLGPRASAIGRGIALGAVSLCPVFSYRSTFTSRVNSISTARDAMAVL